MNHVIIVGGGIIGMLTARELLEAGLKVSLLDRRLLAQESSWAGGGIVSPLYPWRYADSVTRLASASQALYPECAAELLSATGIDPEYERCGMLMVAPGEEDEALAWAARHERVVEHVDAARIAAIEPALQAPPASALWMPRVAQIRNPRMTQALRRELGRRGATLLEHTPCLGLTLEHDRIGGVRTPGGDLAADAVVVCAGAWTRDLLAPLSTPPDVTPVRGQMLLFHGDPGALSTIVLENNRYVIPRRDGRILFGSTLEQAGFDKSTTAEAYEELHALAVERFPMLQRCPVERHWAGLRPAAPAGVPYISGHPSIPNLFVNAGHYRNGIVLGPASARLTADLMLGRPPVVPPEPYRWTAARPDGARGS